MVLVRSRVRKMPFVVIDEKARKERRGWLGMPMCASRHAGECTGIAAAVWRQGGGMPAPNASQKRARPMEKEGK